MFGMFAKSSSNSFDFQNATPAMQVVAGVIVLAAAGYLGYRMISWLCNCCIANQQALVPQQPDPQEDLEDQRIQRQAMAAGYQRF
jgi:ABC-type nickel/cobalt efflux system permease component RcnA